MSTGYQALVERFSAASRRDDRVAAAFVGGSRGAGTADDHADLDLYLILRDEMYDAFFAERRDFMGGLGDAALLEDFNGFGFDMLLFIYTDGVEGELVMLRGSSFAEIPSGRVHVLVDREGILSPEGFPAIRRPEEQKQREDLRWGVVWFWRDLSQLSRWLARGRLWSAYAHIELMRHTCLNILRLKHDFTSPMESYHKVEGAVDPADLAELEGAFCTPEREPLLRAVRTLLAIYLRVVPPLAAAHGIAYPLRLQDTVLRRLEEASGYALEDLQSA